MARFDFKLNDYEKDGDGFSLIPDGEFEFIVEKAELKQTKAKTGHYLNFTYSIVGDKYENRKVFDLINIDNPNEIAQRIGRGRLHKLAEACGCVEVDDSDLLIDKVFRGMLGVEKGTGGYEDKNVVKKFIPKGGSKPEPASKEATGGANPWDDDEQPF